MSEITENSLSQSDLDPRPNRGPQPSGSGDELKIPNHVNIEVINFRKNDSDPAEDTLDLIPAVVRLEINQGIMSPFVHGSMLISDFHNTKNFVGISGGEVLEIAFNTPGTPSLRRKFVVTSVSPSKDTNSRSQSLYTIEFASFIHFNNLTTKISKHYEGERSSIIKNIFEDHLKTDYDGKEISIQKTDNGTTKFVVPFMSPLRAIEWLTRYSALGDSYDFVFYEDMMGPKLISIGTLKKREPFMTYYTSQNPDFRSANPLGARDFTAERERILSHTVSGSRTDMINNILSGMYSGTKLNFDMTKKIISKSYYFYGTVFSGQPKIESQSPITSTVQKKLEGEYGSRIVLSNEPSFTHDNIEKSTNIGESYFLRNYSNSIMLQTAAVELHGDTRLLPGHIVELKIRRKDATYNTNPADEDYDPYESGRYLVLNVVHHIEPRKGSCKTALLLGRDSLPVTVPDSIQVQGG